MITRSIIIIKFHMCLTLNENLFSPTHAVLRTIRSQYIVCEMKRVWHSHPFRPAGKRTDATATTRLITHWFQWWLIGVIDDILVVVRCVRNERATFHFAESHRQREKKRTTTRKSAATSVCVPWKRKIKTHKNIKNISMNQQTSKKKWKTRK